MTNIVLPSLAKSLVVLLAPPLAALPGGVGYWSSSPPRAVSGVLEDPDGLKGGKGSDGGPLVDRDALGPGHGAAADRRGVRGYGVGQLLGQERRLLAYQSGGRGGGRLMPGLGPIPGGKSGPGGAPIAGPCGLARATGSGVTSG